MRRVGLLVFALMAVAGLPCQAGGKGGLQSKMPKFIQANNGLGAVAAVRGGEYLTRVIMHFAGLDPPLDWVAPPREDFPDWMDERGPLPAAVNAIALGSAKCGAVDFTHLAKALTDGPPAGNLAPDGLIRVERPASLRQGGDVDMRSVYGHDPEFCPG